MGLRGHDVSEEGLRLLILVKSARGEYGAHTTIGIPLAHDAEHHGHTVTHGHLVVGELGYSVHRHKCYLVLPVAVTVHAGHQGSVDGTSRWITVHALWYKVALLPCHHSIASGRDSRLGVDATVVVRQGLWLSPLFSVAQAHSHTCVGSSLDNTLAIGCLRGFCCGIGVGYSARVLPAYLTRCGMDGKHVMGIRCGKCHTRAKCHLTCRYITILRTNVCHILASIQVGWLSIGIYVREQDV